MLELTLALFILTVGVFGMIQMFHFGIAKMRTVNEANLAMRAIQNEMETLRALPFSELQDVAGGPFVSDSGEADKLMNAEPLVTIRDHGDPALRLKEVTVRVAWTGEHGRRIEKRVSTLIADKE
jgi:hypothetical protein